MAELTTIDCNVREIDLPFLKGAEAFFAWMISVRNFLEEPACPYSDEKSYEQDAWYVGYEDARKLWLSWQ